MDNQTTVTKLAFSRRLRRTGVKLKADMAAKGKQKLIILLALIALFLIFSILNGNFVDKYNIVSMAQSLAPYAIMSLFVTFVIATGGIDLSIGTVCIASAVVAGKMHTLEIIPLWATIPVMIAIGALFGIINGFLVAKAKLPNFIATLGTMMFARGMSALIVKDPNIFFPTGTWYNKVFSNANGIPVGIFWVIGIMLVCMYIMYKNKIGRYILSIGSNEEATRLSGINTDKYKIIAYTLSGMGAGIAAIFWSASFTTVAAATGNGMELDAIAGVYIGGTSAAGGVASVIGSVIGAMMLVVIRSGLNFVLAKFDLRLNATYVTFVLTGIIVVFAVLMDVIKEKNASKVKIESDLDKYKRETREAVEEYKLRLDLLISDRSIQASEKQRQVEALKKELQDYKLERKTGLAALKK